MRMSRSRENFAFEHRLHVFRSSYRRDSRGETIIFIYIKAGCKEKWSNFFSYPQLIGIEIIALN